jgi:hypothetical protein
VRNEAIENDEVDCIAAERFVELMPFYPTHHLSGLSRQYCSHYCNYRPLRMNDSPDRRLELGKIVDLLKLGLNWVDKRWSSCRSLRSSQQELTLDKQAETNADHSCRNFEYIAVAVESVRPVRKAIVKLTIERRI